MNIYRTKPDVLKNIVADLTFYSHVQLFLFKIFKNQYLCDVCNIFPKFRVMLVFEIRKMHTTSNLAPILSDDF